MIQIDKMENKFNNQNMMKIMKKWKQKNFNLIIINHNIKIN